MKDTGAIPFSVLDLAPVKAGGTVSDALRESLDLARHAEELGYRRYWLAEHHNMTGIASAATRALSTSGVEPARPPELWCSASQ